MGRKRKALLVMGMAAMSAALFAGPINLVRAEQSTSSNYRVSEVIFGSGGELKACSDSYCSKQSAGETAVGQTSSDSYSAQVGFNTTDEPLLEVAVNGAVDFGELSFSQTKTGTANVQVRSYLTNGYTMVINGAPPATTAKSLTTLTIPTASQVGVEQFGINLRQNTTPAVGANPEQVPDSNTSFGEVAPSYAVPDYFMYKPGDIVAYSNTSTGQTNYTISMIANASQFTGNGTYTASLSVVVTSAF